MLQIKIQMPPISFEIMKVVNRMSANKNTNKDRIGGGVGFLLVSDSPQSKTGR